MTTRSKTGRADAMKARSPTKPTEAGAALAQQLPAIVPPSTPSVSEVGETARLAAINASERQALDSMRTKQRSGPRPARMRAAGVRNIEPDHDDPLIGLALISEAIGSTDPVFISGLISQLCGAVSPADEPKMDRINFGLAAIQGIAPKDTIEALLATQMAAVHMATMTFAMELRAAGSIAQQDSAERTLNKLARTFTTQIDALKRYRSGGEQKMVVEHVHVHAGGQAVVGHIASGSPARVTSGDGGGLGENSAPTP